MQRQRKTQISTPEPERMDRGDVLLAPIDRRKNSPHKRDKIDRPTWLIFECHTTFTGLESTTSSFTISSESLLMNTSLPSPPFALAPTPVTTYLSSGLKIAFVCGYNVVISVFTDTGFLNDRKSHTVKTRGMREHQPFGNERTSCKTSRLQHGYVRLTVSSPPLVKTVLPSTEKTIEPVSTPLACAPSMVMFGRTKFELACHM